MRTLRLPGGVDFETVVDAFMALQELARKAPRFRETVSSLIEEMADEWDKSLPLFIEHAAAYVERSQRVAERFESWRVSKRNKGRTSHGSILEIGEPDRPSGAYAAEDTQGR